MVYAYVSGTYGIYPVWVQVPPRAPTESTPEAVCFLLVALKWDLNGLKRGQLCARWRRVQASDCQAALNGRLAQPWTTKTRAGSARRGDDFCLRSCARLASSEEKVPPTQFKNPIIHSFFDRFPAILYNVSTCPYRVVIFQLKSLLQRPSTRKPKTTEKSTQTVLTYF